MNPTALGELTASDLSDHYKIFTIISKGIDKKKPFKTKLCTKRYVKF